MKRHSEYIAEVAKGLRELERQALASGHKPFQDLVESAGQTVHEAMQRAGALMEVLIEADLEPQKPKEPE